MSMTRLKMAGRTAVYHCISRVVGGERLLDEVCRERFTGMMWRMAGFCGVEIITFCIMANHIHILVRVPSSVGEVSDQELLARLKLIYGKKDIPVFLAERAIKERGKIDDRLREAWIGRMGDVSQFMKGLKQRFSRWYNRVHNRYGTFWAERFKSVLVEDRHSCVEAVAAYVDLNPVRAGLVRDPKEYRHCGYAEALSGNKLARKGLLSFLEEKKWDEAAASYRMRLFVIGSGAKQYGKQELTREEMRAVLAQGGQLSVAEVLRLRVRHMSDGVALGSRAFVEEVFALNKEKFGAKRKSGARPIKALASIGLASLRDLRVRVLS